MKKLITIILLVCTMSAYAQDPVKKWGQLQVNGSQLCDAQGRPVILRGVSLGWHNLWPRFYNKKVVQTLKHDWNASVIRAAMGIMIEDNYLEPPRPCAGSYRPPPHNGSRRSLRRAYRCC